jgi:DNA-binding NarL/FixJ family response regulator
VPEVAVIDEARGEQTLLDILTPRQFIVAGLVATGRKNFEIAEAMRITEYVVKNYLREIFDRVGCWSRLELALRYTYEFEMGLYPRAGPPPESSGPDAQL